MGSTPARLGVRARDVAVVAVGGGGGAAVRYVISRAEPVRAGTFPLTTFAINVSGALVLAVLLEALARTGVEAWWVRPFAAIGVLGGFTTFSTMSVEAMLLGRGGHVALAAAYLAASAGTGVAVVVTGLRVAGLPRRAIPPDEGES
jgi:CrcB protein